VDYLILRLLCSFLCGLILSQAGSFIQTGTRNILASPSTLGIEGLSIIWILCLHSFTLAMGLESEWWIIPGLVLFLYVGKLFSIVTGKDASLEKIIFLGLTFNLFVGAVFSLWQFFFLAYNLPFPVEVWFGHFRYVNERSFFLLLAFEISLLFFLRKQWRNLQLYSLGLVISRAHSADLKSLYRFFFTFSFCGSFLVISLFGAFSFLGLIFPLVARKIWFNRFDLKGEILFGGLMNGIFFMLTDFICYQFPIMGAEVPVGLIASVVGAVSLIALLWKSKQAPQFLANSGK
jgi:iron complex transport system permease protein